MSTKLSSTWITSGQGGVTVSLVAGELDLSLLVVAEETALSLLIVAEEAALSLLLVAEGTALSLLIVAEETVLSLLIVVGETVLSLLPVAEETVLSLLLVVIIARDFLTCNGLLSSICLVEMGTLLTGSLRLIAFGRSPPFSTLFDWTVACFGSLVNLVLALRGDFICSIILEAPLTTFDRSCL